MSDPVTIAIVASLAPTIAAIAALISSLVNGRKVTDVHTLVNGNLDAMRRELNQARADLSEAKATIVRERTIRNGHHR